MTSDADIDARLARITTRMAHERQAKRAAAKQYLPELDASFNCHWRTFRAAVEYLETPAGTWDQDPTAAWPRVRGDEMATEAWIPPTAARR